VFVCFGDYSDLDVSVILQLQVGYKKLSIYLLKMFTMYLIVLVKEMQNGLYEGHQQDRDAHI